MSGKAIHGEMEAEDAGAVAARLQAQGHYPVAVSRASGRRFAGLAFSGRKSIASKDLAIATAELAAMIKAGMPLDRALELLARVAAGEGLRRLLGEALQRVRRGLTLADALGANSSPLPGVYVGAIRAGEQSGRLEETLRHLAEYMARAQALQDRLVAALTYPAVVVAVAVLSVTLIFTMVVPQFEPVFLSAGDALPASARLLLACSHFLADYGAGVAVALVGLGLGSLRLLRRPDNRYRLHAAVLRMPLARRVVVGLETARFASTLATLEGHGVPLEAALASCAAAAGNMVFAQSLRLVAAEVREGGSFGRAVAREELFPDLACELVRLGEETGCLGEMLSQVAKIYEAEVQRSLDRLLALLAPTLTVGLGVVVAAIIATILTAILAVNNAIL